MKLAEVQTGDVLLIKPGEKIPADGVIVNGSSALNESMLTGESQPVEKGVSEHPIATGILAKAEELEIDLLDVEDFEALKGKGIQGQVAQYAVKVVGPGYLKEHQHGDCRD